MPNIHLAEVRAKSNTAMCKGRNAGKVAVAITKDGHTPEVHTVTGNLVHNTIAEESTNIAIEPEPWAQQPT